MKNRGNNVIGKTISGFGRHRAIITLCAGLLLVAGSGCSDFLEVDNPASLLDEDLERKELLGTLANTPEGNIAGTYSSLLTRHGLLSDELFHPTTQLENIDAMRGNRLASNSAVEGHWRGLAQSRWLADEVADRLAAAGGNDAGVARAHFFGGIARITMADHYNVIVYGAEDQLRGPIDVIEDALARFQQAAQVAQGSRGRATSRPPPWDRLRAPIARSTTSAPICRARWT